MEMDAGLGVDDQPLAPGLDVVGRHHVGGQHHQVGLERDVGAIPTGADHVGAEREVGHELPVHHIPLDQIDAGVGQRRRPRHRAD